MDYLIISGALAAGGVAGYLWASLLSQLLIRIMQDTPTDHPGRRLFAATGLAYPMADLFISATLSRTPMFVSGDYLAGITGFAFIMTLAKLEEPLIIPFISGLCRTKRSAA